MPPEPEAAIQNAREELAAAEVGVTVAEAAIIAARRRESAAWRTLKKVIRDTTKQARKESSERAKGLVRDHSIRAASTLAFWDRDGRDECEVMADCGERFTLALSITEFWRIKKRFGFTHQQRAALKRTAEKVDHADEPEVVVPSAFTDAFG